ncbi:MAG: substrate-binding domain-containing protein [Anaerolineae bacterium]
MATIRDVAKRAGVAPITVSRVINKAGYISEETRQRVESAIAELGYVPNQLAQSLRYKKSNTLALILSDIINPFWMPVTRGVEDACSEHGLNVVLCNTDESQAKLENYVDVLLQRQADGFLLVPVSEDRHIIEKIHKQKVPLVLLDRRVPHVAADVVRSDSEDGALQLVQYLLALGHERIALLAGPRDVSTSLDRVTGYQRAMTAAQMPIDDDLIQYGGYNQEHGYSTTARLLALPNPPTAFFGGNNLISLGILKCLYEQGYAVPRDFSVVSFDDMPPGLMVKPFLTAVTQSSYDMGYQAAQLLIRQINGEDIPDNRDIVLPVELVEHESCRAL